MARRDDIRYGEPHPYEGACECPECCVERGRRQQAARIAALEAWQAQATLLLRQCRREAWDEYSADGAEMYARIDAFIGAPDAATSEPDFSRYDPALE